MVSSVMMEDLFRLDSAVAENAFVLIWSLRLVLRPYRLTESHKWSIEKLMAVVCETQSSSLFICDSGCGVGKCRSAFRGAVSDQNNGKYNMALRVNQWNDSTRQVLMTK
jgi:hypothetical protein